MPYTDDIYIHVHDFISLPFLYYWYEYFNALWFHTENLQHHNLSTGIRHLALLIGSRETEHKVSAQELESTVWYWTSIALGNSTIVKQH
jgi:hypothetical protein